MSGLMGMAIANVPKVHAAGKKVGFEDGKQAEYNAFWDYYQNTTQYLYAFSYMWRDEIYHPNKNIALTGTNCCNGMYQYSKITDTKVRITFYADANGGSNASGFMLNAINMRIIREVIFDENTIFANSSFQNCTKLEIMNVGGTIGKNGLNLQWSTLLNKASIESVINALSFTTTGLTVTLSQTAVNNAFTTEEWNALIATKSNWTISLV